MKYRTLAFLFTSMVLLSSLVYSYSDGDGSAGNPYQIANVADFQQLSATPEHWNKFFILTVDIDMSGLTFTQALIAPDTSTSSDFQGTPFTGVFDGNGHTISNLTITASTKDFIGLFGYLDRSGQIRGLVVKTANVTGRYHVACLVGYNYGTIISCCVMGTVTGNGDVGGLCGRNSGTATDCYTTSTVTGSDSYVGGLCGVNEGTITSCYATGLVSNYAYYAFVGGLVGLHWYGTITNCYATGPVNGGKYVGGLVGYNASTISFCYSTGPVHGTSIVGGLVGWHGSGSVGASFWDIETSGQSSSSAGTGKMTSEMKTNSIFISNGWDFVGETANGTEDIWYMETDGVDYPKLSWQERAVTSGVTILVHGFMLGFDSENWHPINNYWDHDRLNASGQIDTSISFVQILLSRCGEGRVYVYEPSTGKWLHQSYNPSVGWVSGAELQEGDLSQETGEIILVFDWMLASNNRLSGQAEAAGEALFTALIDPDADGILENMFVDLTNPSNSKPMHFIGHSRGTVVTSEAVQRLGCYDVKADYVTYLDVHDFDEPKSLTEMADFDAYFHDPAVQVWSNIRYADNFWQYNSVPYEPSGRQLRHISAMNQNYCLTYLPNFPDAENIMHSTVIDWYLGTIQPGLQNGAWYSYFNGAHNIGFSRWLFLGGYVNNQDGIGILTYVNPKMYSNLISYPTLDDEVVEPAHVFEQNDDNYANTTFFNGDFNLKDMEAASPSEVPNGEKRDNMAGWSHHGGGGDAWVVYDQINAKRYLFFGKKSGLIVTEEGKSRTHNRVYIPGNYRYIQYRYKVTDKTESSNELVVYLDNPNVADPTEIISGGGVSLDNISSSWRLKTIEIPEAKRNKVQKLSFVLKSWNNPIDAAVLIDDIKIVPYPEVEIIMGSQSPDFNGDDTTDLLWEKTSTGANYTTMIHNGVRSPFQYITDSAGGTIKIVGLADFDGDGTTDLLWKNASTGANFITMINDGAPGPFQYIADSGGDTLEIVGLGDFNGDGATDLLWENTSTSANFITMINDGVRGLLQYISNSKRVASWGSNSLEIIDLADFDGNGTTDLLWELSGTSANYITLIHNGVRAAFQYIANSAGGTLEIVDLGDFDGDGTTDLLWENASTSANFITVIHNGVRDTFQYITDSKRVASWGGDSREIIDLADFDGNGTTDLLWEFSGTSANYITLMNGGNRSSFQYLPDSTGGVLEIVDLGDFDGDGTTDLLWENISTSANYITLINHGNRGQFKYIANTKGGTLETLDLAD